MTDNWRDRAACKDEDPEDWFPAKNDRADMVKKICRDSCPVTSECLDYALQHRIFDDESGIWGGLSPRQRIKIKRKAA